jgi:Fe-S cluster biogenesis protein NfuA
MFGASEMNNVFSTDDVLVRVAPTPNPNAWKFVMNFPVLNEGKLTYTNAEEAIVNRLASSLFEIEGVRQVHFFKNVITITHSFDCDFDDIQGPAISVIKTRLPVHDANISVKDEKLAARESKPEDVQQVELILDETIRPSLQGDGGDIEVVEIQDEKVFVRYEGACGTCPSATTGTLMAIESILKDEFRDDVEVIPIP